jgi:hypothetical protein
MKIHLEDLDSGLPKNDIMDKWSEIGLSWIRIKYIGGFL